MIEFAGRLILLDIEGTTSNLAFVHEVLFPYARQRVADYLTAHRGSGPVRDALEQVARDAGAANFAAWCPHPADSAKAVAWVVAQVHRLMDADAKQTGLKQLQGLIWEDGYRDGTLRSHVFPEVPSCLRVWKAAGLTLSIYSSGSVAAQKLFFAHTVAGDLTPLFSGYYDTKVGGKREPASYRAIAAEAQLPPEEILFLSDVPEELNAAQAVGYAVGLAERQGNRAVSDQRHPRFHSFEEITVTPIR